MKHTKKCRTCWWDLLKDRMALERWLAEKLGAEFRYAWSVRDELGREETRLAHPDAYRRWLEEGPCASCPCNARCDEICHLRARWWDARMGLVRKRLGLR